MIKVLDSTKSLSTLVSAADNGLGQLNVMNDEVTEELNGIYELEFDVLTSEKHYEDLKTHKLVKINVDETDDEQIFRVYYMSEPINMVCHVKCQHITYDLNKIVVTPFTAQGAVNVKNNMVSHILGTYPFTMSTDITNTTSTFKLDIPRSFRECLGGYEGSILDVFRPEYKWDNLEVKMLAHRGTDNGVRISYGKNLTDFTQEQNNESVYDAVYGFAVVDEVTYEASGIYNKTGSTTPKVKNVDFSSKYETGEIPTGAELLSYATTYATNNDIEVPNVNISISFVPLWQTEEYKNIAPLERVFLGDTVHVYFDKLGVEASARVIKTVFSPSLKRYTEMELGSAKANLNSVINEIVGETQEEATGFLDNKLMTMSKLIANGMGLHITQDTEGRIYLHNAEDLVSSQYQYMITSSGFMLSEDYGNTWNSGWDISGNAVLNSLSTITLKALEIYGSYIEGSQILFGDHNGKYILAQVYNDGVDDVGVTFDGTGYVRFQPQESFVVENLNSSNTVLNKFLMDGASALNTIELSNYDLTTPANKANRIYMGSTSTTNNVSISNYRKDTNGDLANRIYIQWKSTESTLTLENFHYDVNTGSYARVNSIGLGSRSTGSTVTISNFKYDNGTISDANRMQMNSDLSTTFWSANDMRIRSTGAVRIYADLDWNSVTGDYNNNHNANKQDIYLGGYSVKIQAESGGRIYLYWGSTRYYLGVSNGVVTATAA